MFKTGSHQNYQVSVSGGNDRTKFYASLSYTKQDGIVENQGLKRFTGNANLTHTFGRFTLQVTSQISKMEQGKTNEGTSYDSNTANYAFFQSPSDSPFNSDGSLGSGSGLSGVNPLFEQLHSRDTYDMLKAFNTVKLTWNIWDNLKLSEKISYDYTDGTEDVLWDKESNNGGPSGVFQRYISRNEQLNTQTQLTYAKTFGRNTIDALLGFETEDKKYSTNYMSGQDYPGDLYEFSNAGTTTSESYKYRARMMSFLGRLNYTFADRYYLGASYRTDASSRLSRDNRWGSFWSASAAWRFTNEQFAEPIKEILTDGKLRVSYGVNGTLPTNYYDYLSTFSYSNMKYNGTAGMGYFAKDYDLKWEKNKTVNVGIDLTFIDRVTLSLDYYQRKTSDLIYDLPISYITGYYETTATNNTVPVNTGALKNNGVELSITSDNIENKNFSWTTTLTLGHNKNKLEKLYSGQNEIIDGPLIHRVGEAYYSYYLYEYAGVDPQTGDELFYINDGTENARNTTSNISEANKVIVAKHDPIVEGGLTNNFRWKFIDLGFTFTYSIGGTAFDYSTWQHNNGNTYLYNGAVPASFDIDKIWSGPGDTDAELPRFQYGYTTSAYTSRWLMPTDYLRLKNLTLGVSVPQEYISKIGLSKARIYFSGSNLLTWKSKDLVVDPEMPADGLCTFETPALRTCTFGIELNF